MLDNLKIKHLKFVFIGLAVCMCFLLGPLTNEAAAETGVIIADAANMRSGPGTGYAKVELLPKGAQVNILDKTGDWYRVRATSGKVAYIRSDLLRKIDASAPTAPALATVTPEPASASAAPNVTLDGQPMEFKVPPRVENNRVLVPLRAIFEAMGAIVSWDQATQTATATKGTTTVVLPLNSTEPTVNGEVWKLDVPARVIQQTTLAPLRFVGESLGGTATWDAAHWTVVLEKPSPPAVVVTTPSSTQLEGLKISSERNDSGLRIMMGYGSTLDTKISKSGNKITYEFANRQIEGNAAILENMGNDTIQVQGRNEGKKAVVEITLSTGLEYRTGTENGGTKEVLTVKNSICEVQRKSLGTSGEMITVLTGAPLVYKSNPTSTRLEVVLTGVLAGQAQSTYSYSSSLLDKLELKDQSSDAGSSTILILTTKKAAKFAVGLSSDGTAMNIMFIDQSEIQPRIPLVVLDAGHGGKDPGASGAALKEKEVTLDMVKKVGQILKQKNIKYVCTRIDDTYVGLEERTTMANLYNAAVFVSIHNNANTSSTPSGTETYYYAPLETPSLYIQKDERYSLATKLQEALVSKICRFDRGVKQANFAVLRESQMPSALIEMAFISNPAEEALLSQQSFRQLAAQAIADGIAAYMKENIKP